MDESLRRIIFNRAPFILSEISVYFSVKNPFTTVILNSNTHRTNEVNFAIFYFFGYQFAPRYKDIHDKVSKSLYGFKHPSQYDDVLIKPVRKINKNLIIEEWENI